MIPLLVQVVSGAVGGNIAGALLKKLSLGTLGNSIVGILGGGIGGQILSSLGPSAAAEGGSLGNIIGDIGSGGVGGAVLTVIVGLIRKIFAK